MSIDTWALIIVGGLIGLLILWEVFGFVFGMLGLLFKKPDK